MDKPTTLKEWLTKQGHGSLKVMAAKTGYSYGWLSDITRGRKLPGRYAANIIKEYTKGEVCFFEKPKRIQIWLYVKTDIAEKIKERGNSEYIESIVNNDPRTCPQNPRSSPRGSAIP